MEKSPVLSVLGTTHITAHQHGSEAWSVLEILTRHNAYEDLLVDFGYSGAKSLPAYIKYLGINDWTGYLQYSIDNYQEKIIFHVRQSNTLHEHVPNRVLQTPPTEVSSNMMATTVTNKYPTGYSHIRAPTLELEN